MDFPHNPASVWCIFVSVMCVCIVFNVSAICFYHGCLPCVSSMFISYVCTSWLFLMCVSHACLSCVMGDSCLCLPCGTVKIFLICLSTNCVLHMRPKYVSITSFCQACVVYMSLMCIFIFCVCLSYMYVIYVSHTCLLCVSVKCVSHLCLTFRLPCESAMCVYQLCQPCVSLPLASTKNIWM